MTATFISCLAMNLAVTTMAYLSDTKSDTGYSDIKNDTRNATNKKSDAASNYSGTNPDIKRSDTIIDIKGGTN